MKHDLLIHKRGVSVKLFGSYFVIWKLCVRYNDMSSELYSVDLNQGSVIGSVLFIIHINVISHNLSTILRPLYVYWMA